MTLLVPGLFLVLLTPSWVASSPHQPLNLTWQLLGPHENLVKQIPKASPLEVWYPNIVFNLCEVVGPDWLDRNGTSVALEGKVAHCLQR